MKTFRRDLGYYCAPGGHLMAGCRHRNREVRAGGTADVHSGVRCRSLRALVLVPSRHFGDARAVPRHPRQVAEERAQVAVRPHDIDLRDGVDQGDPPLRNTGPGCPSGRSTTATSASPSPCVHTRRASSSACLACRILGPGIHTPRRRTVRRRSASSSRMPSNSSDHRVRDSAAPIPLTLRVPRMAPTCSLVSRRGTARAPRGRRAHQYPSSPRLRASSTVGLLARPRLVGAIGPPVRRELRVFDALPPPRPYSGLLAVCAAGADAGGLTKCGDAAL